ncbi:uncharacterized protein LOC115878327 [Sitophilus oryzae]|uniref:Uncharacterized protein LOC115878327 n=1 Tax=Sitophilus oryzae TaxID=7048 RepID=A0A6J2XHA5_SITOR|nr:uncharacterized protein LOC115878327 [Sitophilus oryzae]
MDRVSLCLCFILGTIYLSNSVGDEDIRCTTSSCSSATCDDIPEKCTRNITNPGTYMLSPDICNCCEYCLANLDENEACSVGDPSNGKHTSICGPGLSCLTVDGETDGTCQKMTTTCMNEQKSYDGRKKNGTLGQMETKPSCDEDGLYSAYKCIPGEICYCTASNGSRIFGQADYSTMSNYMNCDCSKKYYAGVDMIGRELGPHEHFRCSSNGDYDKLQCINEKCLCVDTSDGAPTYPTKSLVNITKISTDTLSCYTSKKVGEYYKTCESKYMDVYKKVQEYKAQGYNQVIGYEYPNCDLDGTYAPVQQNKTHKYCVDIEGNILTAVSKSSSGTLATSMNCKCIRSNLMSSTVDKPACLENGNYNPIQCRRGFCRCVDTDGNQYCVSGVCEYDESKKNTMKCTK